MKHKATVNILLLLWALCASRLVFAATFAQEVRGFDYESLIVAAVGGLCGGALKTIFTLANDNRAVFAVLKEARRDLVISFLAGGAAYLLMLAIESKWPGTITREVRFVGVMAAGWARDALFSAATRLVGAKLDGKVNEFRGGMPSSDPPTSAAVPLDK